MMPNYYNCLLKWRTTSENNKSGTKKQIVPFKKSLRQMRYSRHKEAQGFRRLSLTADSFL